MSRVQNPNLEILELAVEQLGELVDELVFLGGCATGLLITDPAVPPIRITRDVDAIVQVMSLSDYHNLELRLRARGFVEDMSPDAESLPDDDMKRYPNYPLPVFYSCSVSG